MKKVLLLAQKFNNLELSGSIRLQGLAKNLRYFNWKPIIIALESKNATAGEFWVIETPDNNVIEKFKGKSVNIFLHSLVKKTTTFFENRRIYICTNLLKNLQEVFLYPDSEKGWKSICFKTAENVIRNENIDVIISSSPPEISHIIASKLKQKFGITWIADLRDPWSDKHYQNFSFLRNYLDKRLEKKILSRADYVVTVSNPLVNRLINSLNKSNILAIYNGFDIDQFNLNMPVTKKFSLTYTGFIYKNKQNPALFLKSIRYLVDNNQIDRNVLSINFYGINEEWLKDEIKKNNLVDLVYLHDLVKRYESIEKQKESQLLLFFTWDDISQEGIVTAKLFDYLAARRPILSMGYTDGGVVKELLDQTQAGVHVSNEEELKDYLMKAYQEYKEAGAVQYRGIDAEVIKYSHREMARKFAEVLDEVTVH